MYGNYIFLIGFAFTLYYIKILRTPPEDMYERVDEMNEVKEVCRDHSVWPSVFFDNLARYKS